MGDTTGVASVSPTHPFLGPPPSGVATSRTSEPPQLQETPLSPATWMVMSAAEPGERTWKLSSAQRRCSRSRSSRYLSFRYRPSVWQPPILRRDLLKRRRMRLRVRKLCCWIWHRSGAGMQDL